MAKLTEKDILQDVLVLERTIVQAYGMSITECSCVKMRTLLHKNLKTSADEQLEIFNIMNQKGYYPTEDAPKEKVTKAKSQFEQIKQQLV